MSGFTSATGLSPSELEGAGPHSADPHVRRGLLRETLAGKDALVLPGVTDALGARIVSRTGFESVYVSGAGVANAQFGLPDIGLISLGEIAEQVGRVTAATSLPVIVDADTGYGGPLGAMRTIHALERLGVSGIQIEDQEMPKRCGHFDSHTLIPIGHMQSKIDAMIEARQDEQLLLIARTDARSAYDIDEAIGRAKAYIEAGADAIFVEAPRTVDELTLVAKELDGVPLVVNVVEGGKTPQLTVLEYTELGYKIILFANFLMRTMLRAGQCALQHLKDTGETTTYEDKVATWDERQALFNLPQFSAAEAFYDHPWGEV